MSMIDGGPVRIRYPNVLGNIALGKTFTVEDKHGNTGWVHESYYFANLDLKLSSLKILSAMTYAFGGTMAAIITDRKWTAEDLNVTLDGLTYSLWCGDILLRTYNPRENIRYVTCFFEQYDARELSQEAYGILTGFVGYR